MRLTGRFAASNARRGWPEYRWVRDRTAVPTRSISEAPKTPFRPSPFQTSSRRPTAAGRDRPRRVLHSRHPPTFQRPDRDEYRLRKEPATCRPRAHQGWRRRQARTRSPTRGRYLLWPTWPGAVEPFACAYPAGKPSQSPPSPQTTRAWPCELPGRVGAGNPLHRPGAGRPWQRLHGAGLPADRIFGWARSAPDGQRTGVSGPGGSMQPGQRCCVVGHPLGRGSLASEVLENQDAGARICCQQGRHNGRPCPPSQPQCGRLPGVPVAGIRTGGDLLDDRRGTAELDEPDP